MLLCLNIELKAGRESVWIVIGLENKESHSADWNSQGVEHVRCVKLI